MLKAAHLYEIRQVSDIYCDAMVRSERGDLMLLSCYGRDTAIKELMARIQIQGQRDGIDEITLIGKDPSGRDLYATASLYNPKELLHHTGRMPRGLFGQLIHSWIYNPVILGADKGAQQSWVIQYCGHEGEPGGEATGQTRLRGQVWEVVKHLSPIPLLEHWREPLLEHIWSDMVFECGRTISLDHSPLLSKPVGPIQACCIKLSDEFSNRVCRLVRCGTLTLEPRLALAAQTAVPLALAA